MIRYVGIDLHKHLIVGHIVDPAGKVVDTFRYDNVWDTDLRVAKTFKLRTVSVRLIGDLFNVLNANTALVRNNNLASTVFNVLGQNLSPRIFRVGVVFGF